MSFREPAVGLVIAVACALSVRYGGRVLLRRFDVRRPRVQLVVSVITVLAAAVIGGLLGGMLPEPFDYIGFPVCVGLMCGGVSALASTLQSRGTEKQG